MIIKKALCNERGNGFLVLMTTLNMLLLAFFIVLNSIAVLDDKNIREALGSLLGTMGMLTGGHGVTVAKGDHTLPRSIEMMKLERSISKLLQQVEKFSLEEGLAADVAILHSVKGIKIALTNKIVFDEGKANLKPKAKKLLIRIAALLSETYGRVNVMGNTVQDGYRAGPFPDDWTLSFARAGKAADFLVNYGKIHPRRLSISGYGATRPMPEANTPELQRLNDRLEILWDRRGI